MDEYMFSDGHSLWIVVFLIVIVVTLSCGLLGFICKMIITDDFYSEGVKPMFVFTGKVAHDPALIRPTKIVVTKPKDSLASVVTELTSKNEQGGNNSSKYNNKPKRRPPSSESDEIIFSCDQTPAESPTTEKVYHWSKSNNCDYTACTNNQTSDNRKVGLNHMRAELNSPLSVYSNFSNRCYSAPSRPHVNRTDTVLYM